MNQSRYIAEKNGIVKLKEVNFENKAWTYFKGSMHKDIKKQVETIEDWKKKFKDIMGLKEHIIKQDFSGVTITSAGIALFLKDDHVITKEDLVEDASCEITWVYDSSKEEKPADESEEKKNAEPKG